VSVRLRGEAVELRPFRDSELGAVLASEMRDLNGELDEEASARLRDRIAAAGTWGSTELLLGVEAGGRLIGTAQVRRSRDLLPPGVFELGIGLDEDARGRGYGTDVIATLARYLFEEEGAVRVQLGTDVDNAAMRRSAEKANYRFEGVMRSFWQVPDGPPRDYALYAMTRADREGDVWTRTS
jgi:RimJ/RimL family protein N-acetyltransferase